MSGQGPGAACRSLLGRLEGAVGGQHPVLTREEIAHIAACPGCRSAMARTDPASIFSLLALESKEDSFWTGFETRVFAEIRSERRQRRAWLAGLVAPRFVVLCAGAALIAFFVLTLKTGPEHDGGDLSAGIRPQESPAAIERVSENPFEPEATVPAPVESVFSPTARIISIRIGPPGLDPNARAGGGATSAKAGLDEGGSDVVLIVDQGIDI